MAARIDAKTEKSLREALHGVTRTGKDEIPPTLAALDEHERTAVGALALTVTAYALIAACGNQWPVKSSRERIARTLATKTKGARAEGLDPEQIYAYLSRTVFGKERLEDVIPDEPAYTRLPIVVAMDALAVYSPGETGIWDYLAQIEAGIEEASGLNERAIPAAVMLAYMKPSE
jgi:hypothetical protein